MQKMLRKSLSCSAEDWADLERMARERGISVSAFIRSLIGEPADPVSGRSITVAIPEGFTAEVTLKEVK